MATKKKATKTKQKDPACVEFGSTIRKCREARRLSQIDAAKLMDVERTSLNRWENGHEMPSGKAMQKLQKHLQVAETKWFGEQPDQLMLPFDFEPFAVALRISPQSATVQFELQLKKLVS